MDHKLYKDLTVSRGVNYHYYHSPSQDDKPTILFLHGFPSTSHDWRHQASFFSSKGFGVIVPDMLGYGGTSKPEDPAAYVQSLIVKDLIDLLDHENISNVISVGHDWGSVSNSRLINFYPERVKAAAFIAVGYAAPNPKADMQQFLAMTKEKFGYELFGYQLFFAEEESAAIIETHFDSFYSIFFPANPEEWKTHVGPTGAIKAWLLADKKLPLPSYISEEEKAIQKELLLSHGLRGPVNWYKVKIQGFSAKDDELVPADRVDIKQPVFFAGCAKDYICLPALGRGGFAQYAKNSFTYKELDADHWAPLSHPDELNNELLKWIEEVL